MCKSSSKEMVCKLFKQGTSSSGEVMDGAQREAPRLTFELHRRSSFMSEHSKHLELCFNGQVKEEMLVN